MPLSSAQMQFSLLSFGPEQTELLLLCEELGISVITYSPLAFGLLTGRFTKDKLSAGSRGAMFKCLLSKIQNALDVVKGIARSGGKTHLK